MPPVYWARLELSILTRGYAFVAAPKNPKKYTIGEVKIKYIFLNSVMGQLQVGSASILLAARMAALRFSTED
jgi:hypothetical protein